ncbi:unnamed protein product [Bemisia tabaci]|uniref:NADH dehydrogenase [ubiquinone] 1 beta subcomplex subunit 7 n=1 Tax=Bemisia tabaci TaxID=7038 RepID=A0A9P0EYF4_BEMTA|nr:unnamed protein product [Bemisia tabaci]
MGNTYNLMFHPDVTPYPDSEPTFDPTFGFKEPRQPKVMHTTLAEMESAKVPPDYRNYCAHTYIDFQVCRSKNFPLLRRCADQYHAYQQCLYDETIDQYKDYERERRLLVRAKRIAEKKERREKRRKAAEMESD